MSRPFAQGSFLEPSHQECSPGAICATAQAFRVCHTNSAQRGQVKKNSPRGLGSGGLGWTSRTSEGAAKSVVDLAHQRHQHRDHCERGERQPDRPRLFAFLPVCHAAEKLAVRLERKEHPESVSRYEQHRESYAQLVCERRAGRGIGLGDRRRDQERDHGQKEQPGLQSGTDPVVFLRVVFDAAEKKRRPQHEQRVGDDRAGDGRLYQHRFLAGAQRRQRDDQFGQVPQCGIEQAADRITRLGRHGLGGTT